MPWKTLNLDYETATERDVRRAYSKLLKRHRPDQDPDGFQRIHSAYLQARNQLKYRQQYFDDESTEDEPDLSTSAEETEFDSSIQREDTVEEKKSDSAISIAEQTLPDKLETALETVQSANSNELEIAATQLCDLSIEYPENITAIDETIADAIQNLGLEYCQTIKKDFLLRLLEHEATSTAYAVISQLAAENSSRHLTNFGVAILDAKSRLCHTSAAEVAINIAESLIYIDYFTVERLLDFAYQNLPPSQRDHRLRSLNYQLGFCRVLRYLEPADRQRWRAIIAGESKLDHNDKIDRSFLKRSGKNIGDGASILNQYLEHEAWLILSQANEKSLYKEDSPDNSSSDSSSLGCFLLIAVFLVIKMLMTLGR